MKKIAIIIVLVVSLHANITFDNITSSFKQTITNDMNQTITYKGEIFVDDDRVLWEYQEPIVKSVLVKDSKVFITEPEIYQMSVINHDEGINLKKIYEDSTMVEKNMREVVFDGTPMRLTIGKEFIDTITFKDKLDNQIEIVFFDIRKKKISEERFQVDIPEAFDVIYR